MGKAGGEEFAHKIEYISATGNDKNRHAKNSNKRKTIFMNKETGILQ